MTFDVYTPPMLEHGRLVGDEDHLQELRERVGCVCCPRRRGSICADPGCTGPECDMWEPPDEDEEE